MSFSIPGQSSESTVPENSQQPVGFLELFYDLIFVAATMVLSNTFAYDVTLRTAGTAVLMFVLVWLLWFHSTILMNLERRDDGIQRALIAVQMLFIILTTLAYAGREQASTDYVALGYGIALVAVSAAHHRATRGGGTSAQWAAVRRNRLLLAGAMILLGIFTPDGADFIFYAAAIAILILPTSMRRNRRLPTPLIDVHHLTERAALLTLIMCGEAFVKVSLVVSSGSITNTDVIAIVIEFVVMFALFWTYFDDIPLAGIRRGALSAELWMLAHLPLQIGIVALAIGMSKFLQVEPGEVHSEAIPVLVVAFLGIYGGLALVGILGERTPQQPLLFLRLVTAALAIATGVVVWSVQSFSPGVLVVVLAVLALAHGIVASILRSRTSVPEHESSSIAAN
jgi:low temperature requirement protein LtrA